MTRSEQPAQNYRVRMLLEREQRIKEDPSGPCFCTLEAAQLHAMALIQSNHQSVIVEKLAPGGCWLQLLAMP